MQQILKTQIVTYLKISNCDKTQVEKKLETQITTELRYSNGHKTQNQKCYKTQNLKFMTAFKLWQNSKTQIGAKLKSSNVKCDTLSLLNGEVQ